MPQKHIPLNIKYFAYLLDVSSDTQMYGPLKNNAKTSNAMLAPLPMRTLALVPKQVLNKEREHLPCKRSADAKGCLPSLLSDQGYQAAPPTGQTDPCCIKHHKRSTKSTELLTWDFIGIFMWYELWQNCYTPKGALYTTALPTNAT